MTPLLIAWLRAFGLTLAIELLVAPPLLAAVEPRGLRRASAVALANLASHPAVWFVFPELVVPYAAQVGLSELWAVGIEILAYRVVWPGLSLGAAARASLLANAASLAVGLALRAALGWP